MWPKANEHRLHVQSILKARSRTYGPSSPDIGDVEFVLWLSDIKKYGSQFFNKHFDWWMFPWTALPSDSSTAHAYSVQYDDIVQLIREPGFIAKYLFAIQGLIRLKNEAGIDVVTTAHPARPVKIILSMENFLVVASDLDLVPFSSQILSTLKQFKQTFGAFPSAYQADQGGHLVISRKF